MTMLYKYGTMMEWHGKVYDTIIVKDEEIEGKLKEGWVKHPTELEATKQEAPKRVRKAKDDELD